MGLSNFFKLEKLKVIAYKDRKRSSKVGTFEAMYNPDSFSQKYAIKYEATQGINTTGKEVNYTQSIPEELGIKLLLDGTGVSQFGILSLFDNPTVSERVEEFLDLTFRMNGDIHEPNFLVIEWGDLTFSCRLGSVDITYTSFNRDGTPLRAELAATFIWDADESKRLAEENKKSADLTHSRIVKSGDTLPLLTKAVYGSSAYYVRVAQANSLDDFRNLTPGQEIFFPPLEK